MIPTIQYVHALDFYAITNTKRSPSGACAINPRVLNYCLVKFMMVLINMNVPSIMVFPRNHLVKIVFFAMLEHQMMNIASNATFSEFKEIGDKQHTKNNILEFFFLWVQH